MAITIDVHFDSAVIDANMDIFVKSYIEDETTIIEFDTRKRNYKKLFGIKSRIKWGKEEYVIDVKELSTFYCPIVYRIIVTKGSYYDSTGVRRFFTPALEGVSTSQHVSKSIVRLCCFLAVNCGVTLRNIATIFTHVFLVPTTKSSVKRWIDEIGQNLPSDTALLEKLIDIQKPSECHIDGYYPMGTKNCVMVVKDEYDRILITHEAESESKDEAIKFLEKIKKAGLEIVSAFSDYSKSFTEAIREVFPDVKFQADHFHTVKNIWKYFKKAYLGFRRETKERAKQYKSKQKKQEIEGIAKRLWELRWVFLKKPCNLTEDEKKKIKDLECIDKSGFLKDFRSILKNVVSLFDKSGSEASAKAKLLTLKEKVHLSNNGHYAKIVKFLDEHWAEAMHYLKKDGPQKRASNSESGMRLLRRLEKNHDGIRSEATRKNYIKIYQTITYLANTDIADFIDNPVPDW